VRLAATRWSSALVAAAVALVSLACTYGTRQPAASEVDPSLLAVADDEPIAVCDALEALIAKGTASTADREYAYWIVRKRGAAVTAADAFARAATAGRVAELRGLNAERFVGEVETFGRQSHTLDPTFRRGAATRMLGTLYVVAPGFMVSHGDSETGLEMLQALVARWPEDVENHLRLAEAYLELGDEPPAYPHLCWSLAHVHALRADEQALLRRLVDESRAPKCPHAPPPTPPGVPPGASSPAPEPAPEPTPGPAIAPTIEDGT